LTGGNEVVDYRTHTKYVDMSGYARFVAEMMKRGIRMVSRGVWFVSEAHSEKDFEVTLSAAKDALLLSRE
jgi:glutamate-1-semialdehyde 2,1-aminomutase